MEARDPVRAYLRAKGCAPHVVENGLDGLVQGWENALESVARGYDFHLEDYLNDMDGRQLLEETLDLAPGPEREKHFERVRRVDAAMKALVKPVRRCLWGNRAAKEEGWTPEKNWWYFRCPVNAGDDLLRDLEKEQESGVDI